MKTTKNLLALPNKAMQLSALSLAVAASLSLSATAHAQSSSDSDIEEVVVKAHPLHEQGLAQSLTVLSGDELSDSIESNLGDTLANKPGIRSASFGAAAGRPIIHGLGGPRVKTTEDTIDSLDVSVTSTDHAVTVEPFIAEQISVLKGASTLLYGSGAIGGVVDTETGRIPTELNEEVFTGRGEIRLTDNGDGTAGAIRLDGNLGSNFAWHFDAFSKEADDYEIPGFAESAGFRALEEEEEHGHDDDHDEDHDEHEEEHEEEHGHEEEEEVFGVLEGSRFDIQGYAGGLSWVDGENYFGISVSGIDGTYGLVGGHGHHEEEEHEEDHEDEHEDEHEEDHDEEHEDEHDHEEEGEEEPGRIDLEQTRFDLGGRLATSLSAIDAISFRVGVNDYEHLEIEGNGEVGTLFDNEAWEARILAHLAEMDGFNGVIGIQASDREFSAIGEEAFVPPSETDSLGLFYVGEREFDSFNLELGARIDSMNADSAGVSRSFTTLSASVGAIVPLGDSTSVSALFDYAERAPGIEELFSNGPHLATNTFEIGDATLDEESSANITFGFAYETDLVDAHFEFYRYDFNDFIYQSATGEEEDELPVLVYRQNDATFTGMDVEVGFHLANVGSGDLDLSLSYDIIDADFDNGQLGNLPRIPSDRWGATLKWSNDVWRAKLVYADVAEQDDNAIFELPTDGYYDVSAKLERKFTLGETQITAFVHGKNLTDEEQRSSVSFVKDQAPAPGRRVEAGIQFKF